MRDTVPIPDPTPAERAHFDAKYSAPEEGCWEWLAAIASGYGRFRMRGKTWRAHRLLFAWTYPEIDIAGRDLDHYVCDNRRCVRPDHLRPATIKENVLRGQSPWAKNHRKTHCIRGHKFTKANTRITPEGKRDCRTCVRLRKRKELAERRDIINERKRRTYVHVSYEDRQCKTCGVTFTPGRKNQWYHSKGCQERRDRSAL